MSCVVPKCSRNTSASKSGNAPDQVSPSMSAGSRPASAIARSAASIPISRAVRPDAFVYSVSPIPTIATSPRTSSKSEACPQSLTVPETSARPESDGPSGRRGTVGREAHRPRAQEAASHAHADRHRRDRPDDRLPRSRPPSLLRLPARQPARPRVARRVRVPRAVHVQERAEGRGAVGSREGPARPDGQVRHRARHDRRGHQRGVAARRRLPAGAPRASRPLLRLRAGRPEPRAWTRSATSPGRSRSSA